MIEKNGNNILNHKEPKKESSKFFRIDKELFVVFFLVALTWLIQYLGLNQYALLSLFFIPIILGSFFFGKRHGTLAAILAVILVYSFAYYTPESFAALDDGTIANKWFNLIIWGGSLVISGYIIGLLYDKKEQATEELTSTYQGVITMLSLVIDSVDRYTHSHSYRVSVYADKIGQAMGLPTGVIEELRIAALLHDLGKIGVSEQVLNKAGKLNDNELSEMSSHMEKGTEILQPLGPRISKILPLILNHHERHDGKGKRNMISRDVPVGARVIAVADVYDALTTDRPYRKALTPHEGLKEIQAGSGTHFDPEVVKSFEQVFHDFIIKEPIISPLEGLEAV